MNRQDAKIAKGGERNGEASRLNASSSPSACLGVPGVLAVGPFSPPSRQGQGHRLRLAVAQDGDGDRVAGELALQRVGEEFRLAHPAGLAVETDDDVPLLEPGLLREGVLAVFA